VRRHPLCLQELANERDKCVKAEAAKLESEKALKAVKRSESLATMAKVEAELLYQRARSALTDTVAAQRASERQASNAIASLNCTEEMRMDAERCRVFCTS
jgi:hypothetical protein